MSCPKKEKKTCCHGKGEAIAEQYIPSLYGTREIEFYKQSKEKK